LAKEPIIDISAQQADPIDLHVGGRLKMRRIVMGLSQEKLAERLGITFQQIQKYERGQNRISAGRLFRLSQLLQVEVAYFFNDHDWAEQSLPANTHQLTAAVAEDRAPLDNPDWRSQESMDLLRHYYNIGDRDLRKRVMEIVKSMAQHSSTDGGTGGSGSSGSAESSAA
jgi:transcriptional regulator with XRE-family HTH domain